MSVAVGPLGDLGDLAKEGFRSAFERVRGGGPRFRPVEPLADAAASDLAGLDRTYISALERRLYAASLDTIE